MICYFCKVEKDSQLFYTNKTKKNWLNDICKDCKKQYNADWYQKNKELVKLRVNNHRKNNQIRYRIKSNGITEHWNIYSEFHTKNCMICWVEWKLVVDHNHVNWSYRWMLCSKCNSWLWMFNDNTTNLMNAINYINNNNSIWIR